MRYSVCGACLLLALATAPAAADSLGRNRSGGFSPATGLTYGSDRIAPSYGTVAPPYADPYRNERAVPQPYTDRVMPSTGPVTHPGIWDEPNARRPRW